jgi:tRNA(fMet)-specific endonuclease VapC
VRVLDTDTCVAILSGNSAVIERRRQTPDRVATTWVTAGELFYRAAKSSDAFGNKSIVERFLETLPVLGPNLLASQFFGVLKADLESSGKRLADADLWIGALARAYRATVVTANTRHFERMDGVRVENWMKFG